MSKSLNKVQIIGNLGEDPRINQTSNGQVANFSVATGEEWKDKQGNKHERTEWHRVVIFGKLAEITGTYLKKGSKVYLEGKLQTEKWTDKQGVDRWTTKIVLTQFDGNMVMLSPQQPSAGYGGQSGGQSGGYGGQSNGGYGAATPAYAGSQTHSAQPTTNQPHPAQNVEFEEDIAF